ncbi:MAG: S41 family peptidase [Bacteroidota bacterium]
MPDQQIHSHFDLKYALEGRIVTLDENSTVIDRGRLFIDKGNIVDIRPVGGGFPDGFGRKDVIKSGGTIFPGLIELHNHLPYNILPFWVADRQYTNHEQWKRVKGYKINVTGPMQTLGKTPGFPEAIVRYVECKSLIGGVTTSQGITLANSRLTKKVFHGLTRNVEETNEAILPEALTRIADVRPGQADAFEDSLSTVKTRLLHLSEGIDDKARSFFTNLQKEDGSWAITDKLNGIHCTGLHQEDFEIFGEQGGTMTWSPMSNLVLYGATADMQAAKDSNILIALGSDWSPSGSKNLLEELKVAYLVSKHHANTPLFSNEELVRMATSNPARILGWENALGSLSVGMKADLVVVSGYKGDPYEKLIEATERSLVAVFINGVVRCGQNRILKKFNFDAGDIEKFNIESSKRYLYLKESHTDTGLSNITLNEAKTRISAGLQNIQQLALDLESAHGDGLLSASANPFDMDWYLVPDFHSDLDGHDLHDAHLEWGASVPFSEVAEAIPIDLLTVLEDDVHFHRMAQHPVPDYIRKELPAFYDRPALSLDQSMYSNEDGRWDDFSELMPLETFLKSASNLSVSDKLLILEQAKAILEEAYVHRVLKKSMYAIHPIDRISLMIRDIRYRISTDEEDKNFHKDLLDIFSSLRDLHTRYILPHPFKNRFAFLPFLVEKYYATREDEDAVYIITTVFKGVEEDFPGLKAGLEVRYWNNIPIERAIELNSENQSGSNKEARMARGLDTLTVRSLGTATPPDAHRILLSCFDHDKGEPVNLEFEWLVSYFPPYFDSSSDDLSATLVAHGFDYDTLSVNHMKASLYSGVSGKKKPKKSSKWVRPTNYPRAMKGRIIDGKNGKSPAGYIRIYSFAVPSATNFIQDFDEVYTELENRGLKGLILDIRGNGGGLITASELLLARLVGKEVEFQKAQFINSELTLKLCENYGVDSPIIDLSNWTRSISLSKRTGDYYSNGYPITKADKSQIEKLCTLPMALITDALCYSAADMFAAGFQDHKLGKVIGIHGNTGAGGANVWSHETLRRLTVQAGLDYLGLKPLPNGANFNFAVRRILRKNNEPIEDLGIRPDVLHKITREDLLKGNPDLIRRTMKLLFEP